MTLVKIFSAYKTQPIHPRLAMAREILGNESSVVIEPLPFPSALAKPLNILCLKFFRIAECLAVRKKLRDADLVYIQGFELLPLALFSSIAGKPTLYETLDNSPHLNYYRLCRHVPFLRSLLLIPGFFAFIERLVARWATERVIVNSQALRDHFRGHAELLYYSSPLEDLVPRNNPEHPPALLYLGMFTAEKGAWEVLELRERLGLRLFVFGLISDESLREAVAADDQITCWEWLGMTQLRIQLGELLSQYYLMGLSLIKDVHYSYATQEANKDIDYLALGIPIIGNQRQTTWQKIEAGCGLHWRDETACLDLIDHRESRRQISGRARSFYEQHYAHTIYASRLKEVAYELLESS